MPVHEQGGLLSTARPTDQRQLKPSFSQWLHTGKETTAPRDHAKTQYQRTTDWTKNILIFSTSKLTKTISPTVWLKLNLDLEKKGIGNLMYFNRRVFLHTAPSSFKCPSRTRQQNARDYHP